MRISEITMRRAQPHPFMFTMRQLHHIIDILSTIRPDNPHIAEAQQIVRAGVVKLFNGSVVWDDRYVSDEKAAQSLMPPGWSITDLVEVTPGLYTGKLVNPKYERTIEYTKPCSLPVLTTIFAMCACWSVEYERQSDELTAQTGQTYHRLGQRLS